LNAVPFYGRAVQNRGGDRDLLAAPLSERNNERVQLVLVGENDVGAGALPLSVEYEDWDVVTVAGDIFHHVVAHHDVDGSVADEVAYDVVADALLG